MSSSNDSKPDNYHVNSKICKLVERYPCMYDKNHLQYLKKEVVDAAWTKIAKEMDDSMHSCKERWRNIRTSFARSINVNKVPASANRTKPYYLHEELQFLARHITPGVPLSRRSNAYYSAGEDNEMVEVSVGEVSVGEESFEGFAEMGQYEEDSEGEQSSLSDVNEIAIKQKPQQPPPTPTLEEEYDTSHKPSPTTPISPPKKRQCKTDVSTTNFDKESDIKPTEIPTSLPSADFDATFLKGLLPEMKAMNFHQKISFKRRIYEVIGEIFDCVPSGSSKVLSQATPAQTTSLPSTTTPTMTVVNAADLATIRRLHSFFNANPIVATNSFSAVPKNVASSTVPPASIALQRGALTRSNTNLLRVRMVNPPSSTVSAVSAVKQEPLVFDD